jgi:hypothetical protein
MAAPKLTLAHVTHEATEQIGGIGAVLEGLISSPPYQSAVGRSILVGPTQTRVAADPAQRLGEHGKVLYSSVDRVDEAGLAAKLRPIEWAWNVDIVYGTRSFDPPGQGRTGEAEVLLIDVFRVNPDRLNVFKHRLWERFGLDSSRYESAWDYEEYVRLAEPAVYALQALVGEEDRPCVVFAHEFMGMPTALATLLDGGEGFRTVFHAHECATARRLVETHPGHDTRFYNVLDHALPATRYVDEVFPGQDRYLRHALVSRSHLCDGVIAVGDRTADELRFLGPRFERRGVDLVYNGLPAAKVSLKQKLASRDLLLEYTKALLPGHACHAPDWLMTHITRPVISKGLWRDLGLCHELDTLLAERDETAVLYLLTSAGGVRRRSDVRRMEADYGWPADHRAGYPDLVGPEEDLWRMIEPFNADHEHVQVVLVNQFGWTRDRIGKRLPESMDIGDLRRATDVELGMATYEPFGISPLEPLHAGALCVISTACGCAGFAEQAADGKPTQTVLIGDYVTLADPPGMQALLQMGEAERADVEQRENRRLAEQLDDRLPRTKKQRQALLDEGQRLVGSMGWDQVVQRSLLPLLRRVVEPVL